MPQLFRSAGTALLGLLITGSVYADIRVEQPYARATPPGAANSAAFMVLHNSGPNPTLLTGAHSRSAKNTEIHNHVMTGTHMQMRPVAHIVIPAGGQAELKPGGYHLMLLGLTGSLRSGESIEIHLSFDNQPAQSLTVPVLPIGVTAQQAGKQNNGAGQMPHGMPEMQPMKHQSQH